ncbi:peptide ABC transporter substrate-binding protein [Filifactor alocis]|uniref:peptide ABC transporter substrate-binding protein n=1 Tax=Filifactor alocis TaxID=143361 RepID=UPI0028D454B9|nr:peptide ABC transporter substrate-binding protein [Filifactor alocis]
MKKRLLALTLVAAMGISLFAGCGGNTDGGDTGAAGGGVVTHNLSSEPKSIDPALNTAVDGHQVIIGVFEGLCRLDEKDQGIPGIAESWDISEDNLTYTFHLRDAKWSDGQPVKASDFVYAWKRAVDPATAAEYAYQMYYLKNGEAINNGEKPVDELGVKAIDDKTLEVTLESVTPYFLQLTAFPTYMPVREDVVSADPEGWALNMDTYIGNGPFKVQEWKHDDVLKLVKNENYYDADKVKLDGIDYVFIVEASTAVSAFESGEIDYMEAVPAEKIAVLEEANDENFKILPYLGTYFYIFNMNQEPVNNLKVRKALSLAINRTDIVEQVTKAGQVPATGFVPKGVSMSDGTTDFQETAGDYNMPIDDSKVEEAKQLMAEAGYPDGQGFPTIELLYNTNEGHKAIAEAIQAMWKQNLGINVELRNEEWKVFQTSRNEGNYTVARHGWIGDYVDPMTFLDMWITASGNNDAKFSNPKYDELISKAKSTLGKERDDAMLEAQAILMEELPVMPIYYYTNAILMRSTVKNAPKSITGPVNYREAYLEK